MKDRKETLKQLLLAAIQEVSVSEYEFNESIATEAIEAMAQDLDTQIVLGAINLLPSGSRKIVVCGMPNNKHAIAKTAVLQCQNSACSGYFCKVHQISQCPLCGGSLK